MITTIIFDVDGTLLDTEHAVLNSLQDTIVELKGEKLELPELSFALGIPGEVALKRVGGIDVEAGNNLWNNNLSTYSHTLKLFDNIEAIIKELKSKGYKLGIITSKTREEYLNDFVPFGLDRYFDTVICVDDSTHPKPHPDPILKYLEVSRTKREEVIYIGDTAYDMQCALGAGVTFGLALWGCHSLKNIRADYYFNAPEEIPYILSIEEKSSRELQWVKLAMELQFLSQSGLAYSKDIFDIERFERIREISAEMMSLGSGYPVDYVKEVFCNETGFQTPKLDSRAAIFQDDKILLVKERNGTWSLPGGWVDVNESIKSNTVKEVKEEAGLNVVPIKLIAVQDKNLHNTPQYAYGVAKAFVLCEIIDGQFSDNLETIESNYFCLDKLPLLAEEKNTASQIKLCFDAYYSNDWNTVFD